MSSKVRANRFSQLVAWAVAGLFILGFFSDPVGAWTGPILGVWFAGTQKPRRGFLWMMAFSFFPHLIGDWRIFLHSSPERALECAAWILLAALFAVLPFTFHRITSPRLPGLLWTLPFPLAATTVQFLALTCLPRSAFEFLAVDRAGSLPLLPIVKALGSGPMLLDVSVLIFLSSWIAAGVIWMWNLEFRGTQTVWGAAFFAALFAVCISPFRAAALPQALPIGVTFAFAWACVGGMIAVSVWALLNPFKRESWAGRPETVALLRSPFTGSSLRVVSDHGRESLVSNSGEQFPIRNGIPTFLKPEDLSGDNGKYNHLYELIGGFYNDIQRVYSPLKGFDLTDYFLSYMRLLEVKPGDSVLETSVGTGLNFKYLPRGVKLSGLDLSPEMLANCQSNLRRWQMNADLYLCNAESLPFADASFDVVFHVGGINFFNDRAKAIREMIRVARPGSLLLIADETEKHVKEVYERGLGGFYKNRKEPVSAPVDLVPAEMQDVHLESLKSGMFYALTFRKPAVA
jgi:ubiquinone/menaquinone biosynthesis C-methylase UbiE